MIVTDTASLAYLIGALVAIGFFRASLFFLSGHWFDPKVFR